MAVVVERMAGLRQTDAANGLEQDLASLEKRFAMVDSIRAKVDVLEISPADQVKAYTETNHDTIALIGAISSGVADASITKQLLVYTSLLSGKDAAGIERALGASGFAVGAFDSALSNRLVAVFAEQESYLGFADEFALPEQRKRLRAARASQASTKIADMRAIALSGDPARIATISASDWFDTKTKILGDLKSVEDAMSAALIEQIGEENGKATTSLFIAIGLLVIASAVAATLSFLVVRSAYRRIDSVVEPLKKIVDGDLNVTIPDHSKNEFAAISEAMEVFRQQALAKEESDRERQEVVYVLRDRLKAMAQGNLDRPIKRFFAKEFAPIRMDFNEAQAALRNLIESVVGSSVEINHSAKDVSEAADDLSQRTAQQAATLEETAAALQKTTKGVRSSAELAQETNQDVARTRQAAAKNGEVVESAVEAMTQIQGSFSEVEQITNMIQDIAFQTNILALNAGVEATRAGEAGKGFGVVAAEVRALAQRSSEAVTSIQQLMTKSAENIAHGATQVTATGSALRDMIGQIDNVTQRVSELAEASKEQAEGLGEVNLAITELDTATQQNAAMAEQSSAASAMLSEEVRKLNAKTALFVAKDDCGDAIEPEQKVELSLSA